MKYFSIIIATYNAGRHLETCIKSILSQSFKDFEIIIKDNNSTDCTAEIIQKYSKHIAHIDTSPDTGIYNAWNLCLEKRNSKYVTFLGADDWINNNNFLNDIYYITKAEDFNSEIIIHGGNLIVSSYDEEYELFPKLNSFENELLSHMSYRHPGSFYSDGLLNRAGKFDERFKISGDHEYSLRCINSKFIFYNSASVTHQSGGASTMYKNMMKLCFENYEIRKIHNIKPFILVDKINIKRIIFYITYKIFGEKKTIFLHKFFKKNFQIHEKI